MGRSVSSPRNCTAISYQDISSIEDEWDFNEYKDNLREHIKKLFPSMDEVSNKWLGNEDRVLMENQFAYIGISTYHDLAAIWLKSKHEDLEGSYYTDEAKIANLCDNWCNRIVPTFDKTFSEYRKIGNLSDGTSMFEKVA